MSKALILLLQVNICDSSCISEGCVDDTRTLELFTHEKGFIEGNFLCLSSTLTTLWWLAKHLIRTTNDSCNITPNRCTISLILSFVTNETFLASNHGLNLY